MKRAGEELGGYVVARWLGSGGMGSVYEVVDAEGRHVALKLLHPHLGADPVARDRLRREVETLHRVRHPAVARVLDAEADSDDAFVVTELIDGPTLDEHVREHGALDRVALADLARQLHGALAAIHEAGVVHRDIKPTNVMLTPAGPVLIDFGISQVLDADRYTLTGLVTGTPGYLDPRLTSGAEPDAAADWWSWAAVLTFAATGRPPFGRGPQALTLSRAAAGEVDVADLPPDLADALRAALRPRAVRLRPGDLLAVVEGDPAGARALARLDDDADVGAGGTRVLSIGEPPTAVVPAPPPSHPPERATAAVPPPADTSLPPGAGPRPSATSPAPPAWSPAPAPWMAHGTPPPASSSAPVPGPPPAPPPVGPPAALRWTPGPARPAPAAHAPAARWTPGPARPAQVADARPPGAPPPAPRPPAAAVPSYPVPSYPVPSYPVPREPPGAGGPWVAPPAVPRPPARRFVLFVLLLLAAVLAVLWPGAVAIAVLGLLVLAGAVGSGSRTLARRRIGARTDDDRDRLVVWLLTPWHLLRSVGVVALAAVVGGLVGATAWLLAWTLITGEPIGEATADGPVAAAVTAGVAAVAIAGAWAIPTSGLLRDGAREVLVHLLPGRRSRAGVVLGGLAVVAVVAVAALLGVTTTTWAPFPAPG